MPSKCKICSKSFHFAGSVSTDTALVLVNALYFKSEFETPFDADDVPATFQTSSGDQVQVETMTSDDMTVGVVTVRHDGSLMLNKLLHGHVSRVRAIHSQGHHLLSGSDDRSVKLWSLRGYNKKVVGAATNSEKPLATLTGHSGPVTGVLLALPKLAFSAAGCTVRLWDVEAQTCLKLLQHEPDCPVTSMSWISTFQAYMAHRQDYRSGLNIASACPRGNVHAAHSLFDFKTLS